MHLCDLPTITLNEVRIFYSGEPILEDGEGPRWSFGYDNFDNDPNPDILLLGAYKHPNTGNNLVGGINLHYLNKKQINKLATALPKIISAGNLKSRYWTGRQLVPDVFNDHYRTYDSKHIRGVDQGVMYPKYGVMKSTKDWLKKKVTNIFKTKQQKEKEAQPQYPDDLHDMQTKLNDVVQQLQRQPQAPEVIDTPEMQQARKAYQKFQAQKAQRSAGLSDVDDQILKHNLDNYETEPDNLQRPETQRPTQQTPEVTPADRAAEIKKDRIENQEELLDPDNEINPDIDLEESIIYFSPIKKRYVRETIKI